MRSILKITIAIFAIAILMSSIARAEEKYIEKKMFSIEIPDNFYQSGKSYYVDNNENIYVLDMGSGNAYVYDKDGNLTKTIKYEDVKPGINREWKITANDEGEVLIYSTVKLIIYDKQGKLNKESERKDHSEKLNFEDGNIYSHNEGEIIHKTYSKAKPIKEKKYPANYEYDSKWLYKQFDKENPNKIIPLRDKKGSKAISIPLEIGTSKLGPYRFQRIVEIDYAGNIYVQYATETKFSGDKYTGSAETYDILIKFDNMGNIKARFEDCPLNINKTTETLYDSKIENNNLTFIKWEKVK